MRGLLTIFSLSLLSQLVAYSTLSPYQRGSFLPSIARPFHFYCSLVELLFRSCPIKWIRGRLFSCLCVRPASTIPIRAFWSFS